MKPINMPGFTADASLERTIGYYQSVASRSYTNGKYGVVSQLRAGGGFVGPGLAGQQLGPWGWECFYWRSCIICCSPWWCWYLCFPTEASFASAARQ